MGIQPIRVCLVDDHTMVRRGMKVLLDEYEDIQVVGEASNGLKAIELVDQLKPDVVLIDLAMPVMDGIEAIKRIIALHPEERIIVLTSFAGDDKLFEAIRAGAPAPSENTKPTAAWRRRGLRVLRGLARHPSNPGAAPPRRPAVARCRFIELLLLHRVICSGFNFP